MNQTSFINDKYQVIREALPKAFCDIVVNYAKFQALYDFTPEAPGYIQVPNTHSRYADFLMESFLLHLQPLIEKHIEKKLLPAYSYFRVYKQGDVLEPHIDRDACEVSATLAFGWPNARPWSFKLSNDKEYIHDTTDCHTPSRAEQTIVIDLEPGDLLIYSGPKVKHWRDPLQSVAYVQAFFHYIYADGPHTHLQFDGRDGIGIPKVSSGFEYIKHSDWMNALLSFIKPAQEGSSDGVISSL